MNVQMHDTLAHSEDTDEVPHKSDRGTLKVEIHSPAKTTPQDNFEKNMRLTRAPISSWYRRRLRVLPFIIACLITFLVYYNLTRIVLEKQEAGWSKETKISTVTQPQERLPIVDVPTTLQNRVSHVRRVCADVNAHGEKFLGSYRSGYEDHLIVDDKRKLMFCFIPKVACTNFKRIFLGLNGVVSPSDVYNVSGYDVHFTFVKKLPFLRDYRRTEKNKRLSEYKKFMFVRDPFERLVSAYRSKLEIHPNPDSRVVFLNMIDAFYAEFPERRKEREWQKKMGAKTNASFKDFLYFILDRLELQGRNNEHFVPMVSLCDPCTVHYDFIGSYENLVADSEHIFKELSIGYHFPARNDNYSATETSRVVASYFTDLQPELVSMVWELFKNDYTVFDIAVPNWLVKYNKEHDNIIGIDP